MIVILKKGQDAASLLSFLQEEGAVFSLQGARVLLDAPLRIDGSVLCRFPAVERVISEQEPFPLASRSSHPGDTVVSAGSFSVGGGHFSLCAGPCSVENEEQILAVARSVKNAGAALLRGGAFKPRTSPYSFSGLREEGLRLLSLAKRETGLPVCSEVMGVRELALFDDVDVLQLGARNMQNYELLREAARTGKPILLKRGMSATLQEYLLSAEYILSEGNPQLILCERGIRSFDDYTRNLFDLSAIPMLKELSHLPVMADPSHATGRSSLVPNVSLAAAAAGADGLLIEVHNDPLHALSDGAQALTCEAFSALVPRVRLVLEAARS